MHDKKISLLLCTAIALTVSNMANAGILDKFAPAGDNTKPLWADEPLVTDPSCDTFTFQNVLSFMDSYIKTEELQDTVDDLSASAQELMQSYTTASILLNRSQLCLAEALELKEVTETLTKEKKILLSGTSLSKKEIKKHRSYSETASNEIIKATAQVDELKPEQRKNFSLGAGTYLAGSHTTSQILEDARAYATKATNAAKDCKENASTNNSVMDKFSSSLTCAQGPGKAANLLGILGSGGPDYTKNILDTGNSILEYSKANKIELPPDSSKFVTSF
ncbi:hypothetical protein [Halioxenophilus sp. WMMB6]|uniref:hypothetical protein n=1 Tax=Halioxenophilus sp. WMMB6 TaxID=3073815 RepID=UPI00295E70C8|nr:hypothetical protein [Halioxenophilus sp. WMMB6]